MVYFFHNFLTTSRTKKVNMWTPRKIVTSVTFTTHNAITKEQNQTANNPLFELVHNIHSATQAHKLPTINHPTSHAYLSPNRYTTPSARHLCYLFCSLYCLCVNVYCTTATGWQPNCSWQIQRDSKRWTHFLKSTFQN